MRVSNISPQVTHAASLSGGGPVYLFHIAEYMRSKGLDPEREVYACWSDILKDPDSVTKFSALRENMNGPHPYAVFRRTRNSVLSAARR